MLSVLKAVVAQEKVYEEESMLYKKPKAAKHVWPCMEFFYQCCISSQPPAFSRNPDRPQPQKHPHRLCTQHPHKGRCQWCIALLPCIWLSTTSVRIQVRKSISIFYPFIALSRVSTIKSTSDSLSEAYIGSVISLSVTYSVTGSSALKFL